MRDGGDHPRMPQGDSFAPTLLIAMPQLQDKNFTRSVILLCEHSGNGAIGFVVNRPTDLRAAQAVLEKLVAHLQTCLEHGMKPDELRDAFAKVAQLERSLSTPRA